MAYEEQLTKILFLDVEEQEKKKREENLNFALLKTYVIIDAARIKSLTNELMALTTLAYENLFSQEDAIKYEEVAPYLIELKKEDDFPKWVYENVYGEQGSIFIHSTEDIGMLAEHLRTFITTTTEVEQPKNVGETMLTKAYVRLYDPRVFPLFISSLDSESLLFGSQISSFYVENKNHNNKLEHFQLNEKVQIDLEGEL